MLLDIPKLPACDLGRPEGNHEAETVTRLRVEMKSSLPKPRSEPSSSGVCGVTSSILKRVRLELDNDDLDMRVVISSCRGLRRGTSGFEEAYITGRLDALAQGRTSHTGIPHLIFIEENGCYPCDAGLRPAVQPQPAPNPFSVLHLGDLIKFFGPWLAVLAACQLFTAWAGSAWLSRFLEGGRPFFIALIMLTFLCANSYVWFRNQGKHFSCFMGPGVVLMALSLLACISLHLLRSFSHLL